MHSWILWYFFWWVCSEILDIGFGGVGFEKDNMFCFYIYFPNFMDSDGSSSFGLFIYSLFYGLFGL